VVEPPAEGSWVVRVEATLENAPSDRLVLPEAEGAVSVAPHADCRVRCKVEYSVDLGEVASRCHRMDCARKVGDAVLGSASLLLLRPEPAGDAAFTLRVAGPAAPRLVTGLRQDPAGGYTFRASELGEAPFTAFGAVRVHELPVAGARLQVALLGTPLAMGDEAAVEFVRQSASRVAGLFGRFPVDATLFVVPVPGADEVVFGRVMSLAGASVALLFGASTPASGVRDNWVVVHELFHLGTPSFVGEGHWLEEGLATYYEPILRERAGWMSEADLWAHFVREMPRGLRRTGDEARLEDRDDIDSTYWGGALFAFLADVRTRAATGNARSLDDAMRAALGELGDATRSARVADFLRVGAQATGARALVDAYDGWAVAGTNPDLDAMWRDLGVVTGPSGVTLRDDAPLSSVRKGIAAIAASALH
jgi:predicted metalloprotease with PDZ domain